MASDAELVATCNKFLVSAPPGEFMEVVTDIRGLLAGKEQLLNSTAAKTFKQYNEEQMLAVQSPGNSHKVLITEFGNAGGGKYIDGKGGQLVHFDHIQQKVTGQSGYGGSDNEPLRKAFEAAAFQYVDDQYPDGACAVYAKGKVITICLQSSKYNAANYWNGRWRCVWHVTTGGGKLQIKGNIKIQVHYYEEGNVQLNTNTNKQASCAGGDPNTSAKNAIAEIRKIEQQFSRSLEISYHTMGDTTFKALRRALPITRTKIDWDKLAAHKGAREMANKNK